MALYAFDEYEDLRSAAEAKPGKTYWCLSCRAPVKRRRGKNWHFQFYHIQTSLKCKLESKKDDHSLVQIQLQKLFPKGSIQLEKPFIQIDRVADACLEREKLIFEIQCSPIREVEVKSRMRDYRSLGYEVVWLLDDQRYNKRVLRPAERLLREHLCYYVSVQQGAFSEIYDQFEIFHENKRVKRGRPLTVDIRRVFTGSLMKDPNLPAQVLKLSSKKYCYRDRKYAAAMKFPWVFYWAELEKMLKKKLKKRNRLRTWALQHLYKPYNDLLDRILRQAR